MSSEVRRFVVSALLTACYIILCLLSERPVIGMIFHLLTEGVSPCRLENGPICYNEIRRTTYCQSKYTQHGINMQFMRWRLAELTISMRVIMIMVYNKWCVIVSPSKTLSKQFTTCTTLDQSMHWNASILIKQLNIIITD